MFLPTVKAHSFVVIWCYMAWLQTCGSSPVLVLVANGSDITINFPGDNNNNRLFSIVSASGNNNPSMFDWIGGNGANKAPTITLERANGHAPPTQPDDSSEDDNLPPTNTIPRWNPRDTIGFDGTDSILPVVATVTQATPSNITSAAITSIRTTDTV